MELQSRVKGVVDSQYSVEYLTYPGDGVAVEDHIRVGLKESSLAPIKSFLRDENFIERAD